PVKRYSSGMKVRLAFAVAAHLEPEILIVDEVLAVGDAEFQARCLGKMRDVASGGGRTVLFVSHNLAAVESLCTRGILLRGGRLAGQGTAEQVVRAYLGELEARAGSSDVAGRADRRGAGLVRLAAVEARGEGGGALATGRPARFTFRTSRPAPGASCTFTIYNHNGHAVACIDSGVAGPEDEAAPPGGAARLACEIDELPLL